MHLQEFTYAPVVIPGRCRI